MRIIRRALQVVTLLATLFVGIVALALITTHTTWFNNWLRRYIIREANQYLNGQLSIGQVGGNLFFGVQLANVAIEMDGRQVVSIKDVGLDYSVFEMISTGIAID